MTAEALERDYPSDKAASRYPGPAAGSLVATSRERSVDVIRWRHRSLIGEHLVDEHALGVGLGPAVPWELSSQPAIEGPVGVSDMAGPRPVAELRPGQGGGRHHSHCLAA